MLLYMTFIIIDETETISHVTEQNARLFNIWLDRGVLHLLSAFTKDSFYSLVKNAFDSVFSGGAFSLFHYDLATKIAAKKLESIAESGAEMVATNCPGCILHISDRLAAAGKATPVVHTIHVVAEALRAKEKG